MERFYTQLNLATIYNCLVTDSDFKEKVMKRAGGLSYKEILYTQNRELLSVIGNRAFQEQLSECPQGII